MTEKLIAVVEELKKSEVRETVDSRMRQFEELGGKDSNEIFKELCFCFLTANYSAEGGMRIQKEIGQGFLTMEEEALAKKLEELGHRYPNVRASYITNSRNLKDNLKEILESRGDEKQMREWIVKNVKGIGMKEASHFLRNIGYKNVAIIDFHIIDLLVKHGIIERPKTLTPKKYLETEETLKELAEKTNLTLGELDFYLWYQETGKILK